MIPNQYKQSQDHRQLNEWVDEKCIKELERLEREENKMATLKEEAKAYVPMQTKNIADLDKVSVDLNLEDREGTDKDGKTFKYKVIVVNGEDYRVPGKVIGDLRSILDRKPDLKTVSVSKKGTGIGTQYTVIPMD